MNFFNTLLGIRAVCRTPVERLSNAYRVVFDETELMPVDVFYHRHRVRDDEMDRNGHVNNLKYLQWCVDAAVAHSAEQGWDTSRYQSTGGSWVVRSHQIEYLAPCFAGQQVTIATWVAGFRRIRSLRKYQIRRADDDLLVATAETWWAYVAIPSMAPRRVPDELRDAFTLVLEDPLFDWPANG